MKAERNPVARLSNRARVLLVVGVLLVVLGGLAIYRYGAALRPEAVRDVLLSLGPWGPLAQIALLGAVLTVPVVPATIFQIAGGWAFGKTLGFVYTMLGDALGACIGFWVARRWGDRVLQRWLSDASYAQVQRLAGRMTWRTVMVLRLLPGPAYTLVSLAAGVSPLRFWPYLIGSVVGVAPWIALLVLAGDVARSNPLVAVGIIVGIVLLAVILGRVARTRSGDQQN
ncbi:MAG: TVP38/TMEM64 family protein [Chloroflexi bacterium]|nr:TVP38/TMEM64 family protein [Chloroflexota bacterium]